MATISVQQPDGEIVLTRDGGPPVTYPVSGGQTTVADAEVDHFLRVVQGAARVEGTVDETATPDTGTTDTGTTRSSTTKSASASTS